MNVIGSSFDLVSEEVEKLCSSYELNFPANVPVTDEEFIRRVIAMKELAEELVFDDHCWCFWGRRSRAYLEKHWSALPTPLGRLVGTTVVAAVVSSTLLFYAGWRLLQ